MHDWAADPTGNSKKIAQTFREACDIAEHHGERLAAEGEICWGGMQGWKSMVNLLETVGRLPEVAVACGSWHPVSRFRHHRHLPTNAGYGKNSGMSGRGPASGPSDP